MDSVGTKLELQRMDHKQDRGEQLVQYSYYLGCFESLVLGGIF